MGWTAEVLIGMLNDSGATPDGLGHFLRLGMLQSRLGAANTAVEIAQDERFDIARWYDGEAATLVAERDRRYAVADQKIAELTAARDEVAAQVRAAQEG